MNDNLRYLYRYIVNYKTQFDGNSPTRREIKDDCGISSTSVVDTRLRQLEAAGLIRIADKNGRISVVGGQWVGPE